MGLVPFSSKVESRGNNRCPGLFAFSVSILDLTGHVGDDFIGKSKAYILASQLTMLVNRRG